MNYLGYLINKDHNLFFEHFRDICECTDVAKSEDGDNFLSWNERINCVPLAHIFSDDARPSLPETHSQQRPGFNNQPFENLDFITI